MELPDVSMEVCCMQGSIARYLGYVGQCFVYGGWGEVVSLGNLGDWATRHQADTRLSVVEHRGVAGHAMVTRGCWEDLIISWLIGGVMNSCDMYTYPFSLKLEQYS